MDNGQEPGVRVVGMAEAYKGKVFRVDKDEFLIGRTRDCDLRMEENTVSGRHARILKVQDHYEIEDLQSTNGTFLNGIRVGRKRLRSADKLKFDQYEFQFIDPADASRTIVATPAALAEAQRTVVRPTPPSPIRPAPAARAKGGSLIGGALLAILLAFLIGLGGNVILQQVQMSESGDSLFGSAGETAKILTISYPLMHQAHLWAKADLGRWQNIVSILLVILASFIGGLLIQSVAGRNRLASALGFSLVYVLAAVAAQFVLRDFDLDFLPQIYSGLLPGSEPWLAFGLGVAYFFGVSFVLSGLGTLLARSRR